MAIAETGTAVRDREDAPASTQDFTHVSNASGTPDYLLLFTVGQDNSTADRTVTGVQFDSVPLTEVGAAQDLGSPAFSRLMSWALKSPNAGSLTVAVSWTNADEPQRAYAWCQSFSGVDQTTPYDGLTTNSATTGTAMSVSVTHGGGDDLVVGTVACSVGADPITDDQTTILAEEGGESNLETVTSKKSGDNLAWTATASSWWGCRGMNLNADAGAPTDQEVLHRPKLAESLVLGHLAAA